jgi:hypothetical protein
MWFPAAHPYGKWWAPLPSRVLKFGKALRPFTQVFDVRAYPKRDQYAVAAKAFIEMQAVAYRRFAATPVLRAVCALSDGGPALALRVYDPLDMAPSWRIQASAMAPRLKPSAVDVVAMRYGVDVRDVHELEDLIQSAGVHAFVLHPLFEKMALVDYN